MTFPGVDAGGGSGFFDDDPYAANVIFASGPSPVLVPQNSPTTIGPFDVRQFQGARYVFELTTGDPVLVVLTWLAPDLITVTGQKFFTLPSAIAVPRVSGFADFALPHLGDFLEVTFISTLLPANALLNVSIAGRNSDAALWNITTVAGPNAVAVPLNGALLFFTGSVPAGTAVLANPSQSIYSGPATMNAPNLSGAGLGSSISLQAADADLSWITIATITSALIVPTTVIVPAAPLRFQVSNGTGGAINPFLATLIADEWRVG